MFRKAVIYGILINICLTSAFGQEFVTGLRSNPLIKGYHKNQKVTRSVASTDTLELPFFDDFSGHSVVPDSTKWTDDYVFINNTYSKNQITVGMATFDALDNSGNLYLKATSSQFEADHLTSQPINLKLNASDSVYLSFFYQAGGLADAPEKNDTLTLQFYAPAEDSWYSVWRAQGGATSNRFKPAVLKITDNRFLQKGFRFRFVNYASLSADLTDASMVGNCDIWNVDYVLLNKNRHSSDTVYTDVAYTLPLRSVLKDYEAMPWKHFQAVYLQEMGSAITVHYRNNDTLTRNVTRDFKIWDVYNKTMADAFSAGATNIGPLTNVDYNANLVYTFNTPGTDSALFKITASLKTDNIDPKGNDTMIYYQVFKNYFAYDDGTSEGGYGINGAGSRNAMVACRFNSYVEDTLRAITVCFNDSYENANKVLFNLVVWGDNDGIPGDVIYTMEDLTVEQSKSMNGFYTYTLPESIVVTGPFYIGWKQLSQTFLNTGYDVNTSGTGRQFYWLNGDWYPSQVQGTIMIRPIVGDRIHATTVNDITINKNIINIWPNPASDNVSIDLGELQLPGLSYITITDLNGQRILQVPYEHNLNISALANGMYIVIISNNGHIIGYNRMIKIK